MIIKKLTFQTYQNIADHIAVQNPNDTKERGNLLRETVRDETKCQMVNQDLTFG